MVSKIRMGWGVQRGVDRSLAKTVPVYICKIFISLSIFPGPMSMSKVVHQSNIKAN